MILEKVSIDYDFDIFLDADYGIHSGSCIKHQVHELTDIHKKYGGFPKSYKEQNTLIHQLWWNDAQVDFVSIGNQLNIEVITVSSIKQPAGNVIPLHRDTFYKIKSQYPNRQGETIVRANIFLEAWKVGHVLQYWDGSDFKTATHWQAGEGFLWDENPIHIGANIGFEPKYTLQISGFYKG